MNLNKFGCMALGVVLGHHQRSQRAVNVATLTRDRDVGPRVFSFSSTILRAKRVSLDILPKLQPISRENLSMIRLQVVDYFQQSLSFPARTQT